ELATFPSSFWTSVLTEKATPPVSRRRAPVYQPCGTDTLHPVVLNGTGVSSKVATNEDVVDVTGGGDGEGGVGVGDAGFEEQASAIIVPVIATVHAAVFRSMSGFQLHPGLNERLSSG